jgi:hypothetical protein
MAKNQNTTAKIDIESLLAKKNQITNAALAAALSKLEEKKREQQEAQLIEHLTVVQSNTDKAVELLRSVRNKEKKAKAYLTTVAEAQNQFYTDGDIAVYAQAIQKANHELNS